jgi:hypothetical protein
VEATFLQLAERQNAAFEVGKRRTRHHRRVAPADQDCLALSETCCIRRANAHCRDVIERRFDGLKVGG